MMGTLFCTVYDRFLGKITDDMYLELTPEDTYKDLKNLLINAIPGFEFPRKVLSFTDDTFSATLIEGTELVLGDVVQPGGLTAPNDTKTGIIIKQAGASVEVEGSYFTEVLTDEEVNILAILMMCGWVQRQVTSIENTRMKYSGTDFKMTSQANHLAKLLSLLKTSEQQSLHMQRLYKRRKTDENGHIQSNWSCLREVSAIDY